MNKNRNILLGSILLLGLIVFALNPGFAIATDDDGDNIEDEFEDTKLRDLTVEIQDDRVEVESVLRVGAVKNKIEFRMRNDTNGAEIGVEFTPNYNPLTNTTEIQLQFEVTFSDIIEYIDIDQDNIFNGTIDTLVKTLPLSNFQRVLYSVQAITAETDLHYFILNTTDGVFALHVFISEEFEIVNNSLITPDETKFAIEISNFNYTSNNSRLALYTKLQSGTDYEEKDETEDEAKGYAGDEEGVFKVNGSITGFFSWELNATIDGNPTFTSDIEDDDAEPGEQKLYFNYVNGTNIYHDPKIGIEGLLLSQGNPNIAGYELILILGISTIGIIFVISKVQKKR